MDILKKNTLLIIIIIFFNSCAKVGYLFEQGHGLVSILNTARDNQYYLKDVKVPREYKVKIRFIEELKRYFYKYWNKPETLIYSQTTFLDRKAVSYLVVASPYEKLEAVNTCFPLMGCFPYLGFYQEKSAFNFANDLKSQGFVTIVRPVYAYSTLGYFTDTILSSFFEYDEFELTELIFHELFHTLFFIPNDVDLNENLANFFSEKMLEEYFYQNNRVEFFNIVKEQLKKEQILKEAIVKQAYELQELYKSILPKNKIEAEEILSEFLEKKFFIEIKKICHREKIEGEKCFPLQKNWNNARFVAMLTYDKASSTLNSLQRKYHLSTKDFFYWIQDRYQDYRRQDFDLSFETYLLSL